MGRTIFESSTYEARGRTDQQYVWDLYRTYLMRDANNDPLGWAFCRLVIFTSEPRGASIRHASFKVGDSVRLVAQPGDRIYVARDGATNIGLSVLRKNELVLALGTVTLVPLVSKLVVHNRRDEPKDSSRGLATWLDFATEDELVSLRSREFAEVSGLYVYVERCWEMDFLTKGECVAICAGKDPLIRFAAARSAIQMNTRYFKVVGWDTVEY